MPWSLRVSSAQACTCDDLSKKVCPGVLHAERLLSPFDGVKCELWLYQLSSPDPDYNTGPFTSPIAWRAAQRRAPCQRLSLGLCRALACYSRMLLRTRPGRASKARIDHSAAHLRQTKWFPCLKPKAGPPHADTSFRDFEGMVKPQDESQPTGTAVTGQVHPSTGSPTGPRAGLSCDPSRLAWLRCAVNPL